MNSLARLSALLCLLFFAATISILAQGSLTPPGPPATTMKTLDQIEPRKEINATNTPGNATTQFVISAPGSYYLAGNITGVSGKYAIQIASDNVTLDLNGFTIKGVGGSLSGIIIGTSGAPYGHHCIIRNGTVAGFGQDGIDLSGNLITGGSTVRQGSIVEQVHASENGGWGIRVDRNGIVRECTSDTNGGGGIQLGLNSTTVACMVTENTGNGISANSNAVVTGCTARSNTGSGIVAVSAIFAGATVSHCTARDNGGDGIQVGFGSNVTNCAAVNNSGVYGILAGEGSTLTNCTAYKNDVEFGIRADDRSTLTNCTASVNTSAANDSWGISAGAQCTVSQCSASGNLNTNGTPTGSTGGGIIAANGSAVQNCTVAGNKGDGIRVSNDARVVGNTCDSNGFPVGTGDGAGIRATASDNRIEGNNVTDNTRGIDVDAAGNLIIKNSASGNTTNYDIVTGNVAFVVAATATTSAITGSSGGTPPGGTPISSANDPWANFSY